MGHVLRPDYYETVNNYCYIPNGIPLTLHPAFALCTHKRWVLPSPSKGRGNKVNAFVLAGVKKAS